MVRARHYETVSKFVKVMPRIPWPLFSGNDLYSYKFPIMYIFEKL